MSRIGKKDAAVLRDGIVAIVSEAQMALAPVEIERLLPDHVRARCGANLVNPTTGEPFPDQRMDISYHLNVLVQAGRLLRVGATRRSTKYRIP